MGTLTGSFNTSYKFTKDIEENGLEYASPFIFPNIVQNMPIGQTAMALKIHGESTMISSEFESGLQSIYYAVQTMFTSQSQQYLCGAVDSILNSKGDVETVDTFFNLARYNKVNTSLAYYENCFMFYLGTNKAKDSLAEIVKIDFYNTKELKFLSKKYFAKVSILKKGYNISYLASTGLFDIFDFIYNANNEYLLLISKLNRGEKLLSILLKKC